MKVIVVVLKSLDYSHDSLAPYKFVVLDSVFREAARPVQRKKNPRSSARLIRVRGELFLVGAVAFRGVELAEDVEFVEGRKDHEDEVPVADFVSFFYAR